MSLNLRHLLQMKESYFVQNLSQDLFYCEKLNAWNIGFSISLLWGDFTGTKKNMTSELQKQVDNHLNSTFLKVSNSIANLPSLLKNK